MADTLETEDSVSVASISFSSSAVEISFDILDTGLSEQQETIMDN